MKTLVIYAHPNPKSFNAAIKDSIVEELTNKGHEVKVRDLYEMNFNPILSGKDFEQMQSGNMPSDIAEEQKHITWADTLIFVYPVWWINMPAILKGYIDRTFTYGFAYHMTENGPEALLKGKKAVVISTAGQSEQFLNERNFLSSMRASMDVGTFGFSGIETAAHEFFCQVPFVTNEDRKAMLTKVKEIVDKI